MGDSLSWKTAGGLPAFGCCNPEYKKGGNKRSKTKYKIPDNIHTDIVGDGADGVMGVEIDAEGLAPGAWLHDPRGNPPSNH